MHSITDLWQKQTYALFATTIPRPLCCYNNKNRKAKKKKRKKNKEEKGKMLFFRTQLHNLRNNFHNISASNRTVGWNDGSAVTWGTSCTLSQGVSDVPFALWPVLWCLNGTLRMLQVSPPFIFLWLPRWFSTLLFIENLESVWVSIC